MNLLSKNWLSFIIHLFILLISLRQKNVNEYDEKKVLLYSQVSALLLCRPNEAKIVEIITTGCLIVSEYR